MPVFSWISRAATILTRSVSEEEEPTEIPRLRFGLQFAMFRLPHKMFTAVASPRSRAESCTITRRLVVTRRAVAFPR